MKATDIGFEFRIRKPPQVLTDFVESFWMLENHSDSHKDVIILPDGRVDLFFSQSAAEPFHITLSGLETQPDQATLAARTVMFAVSFKLLATGYILKNTISELLNNAAHLPAGFWGFNPDDMQDFDNFWVKASQHIHSLLPQHVDSRKRKLFDLIYASNGAMPVKELSEEVGWSSRQINRYFNQ